MSNLGISNFDTETATNFIADIAMNGYGLIEIAIDRIVEEDSNATLTDCEEAIVAAELIAAIAGNPSHELPEDAREFILTYLPKGSKENEDVRKLTEKAADAIDTIVADSELRDLWDDNPDFDEWFQLQVDLQKRILGEQ